jgi:hypothetical protein
MATSAPVLELPAGVIPLRPSEMQTIEGGTDPATAGWSAFKIGCAIGGIGVGLIAAGVVAGVVYYAVTR